MRRRNSLLFYIIIFVLAQLAWMGLLGLWIYIYVSNYLVLEKVGDQVAPQITIDTPSALIFAGGIVLIVAIATGIAILFRNLGTQMRLTKMYDSFIANITHELKSPLASIQLYLQTLNSRDVPKVKQNEFVESMLNDSKRLQKLIDSILEISALETKRIAHNFDIYKSGEVFNKIINESANHFKLDKSKISINGNPDEKCIIDPYAMKIVIDNIIDNAIKYSVDECTINCEMSVSGKKLIIALKDNGIGIPSDEQRNVFKKFHRIYRKDIPSVKGTGLGLYLVRGIIKSHEGKIYVKSDGINSGSTFFIELPVYKNSVQKKLNKLLNSEKSSPKNGR